MEMTNAEKFKEVFGIEIDEYPDDICGIVDHSICVDNNCDDSCPAFNFWKREYKED